MSTTPSSGSKLDELERAGRFSQAARLALSEGSHAEACRLFEKACDFAEAARAALDAGEHERALLLALRSGRTDLIERAQELLVREPAHALGAAHALESAGFGAAAASLYRSAGDTRRGAALLESTGNHGRAARYYVELGELTSAERCLALTARDDEDGELARLALGRRFIVLGEHERALRSLQRIGRDRPAYVRALPMIRDALVELGLSDGALAVEAMLSNHSDGDDAETLASGDAQPVEGAEQTLFGRYRVARHVATSPVAQVFEASDLLTGERVALKLYAPRALGDSYRDALSRFEREARTLGTLAHPHIVPLRAYEADGPCLVFPFFAGGSLADKLAAGPIAPNVAVDIACRVLAALEEAHRRGVLHRDIKPANVLFDSLSAPFLADFGSAHLSDVAATMTHGLVGTLAYMAPEQREGAPASIESDVYGVGALLLHMLTGAPPDVASLPSLPELGERQREALVKLIGKAGERPKSAAEASGMLRALDWPVAPLARPSEPNLAERSLVGSERLAPVGAGVYRDTLLGRFVRVLPAEPAHLARAAAFARADHPALASVLAFRPEDHTLWVEHVEGEPLQGPLGAVELRRLEEALAALHRAGATHGFVRADHVRVQNGETVLAFPVYDAHASEEDDFRDLHALAARK